MPTYSANNHANYRTELVITPGAQSVAGNYTDVKVVLRVVKLSGAGYWSYDNSSWSVNINGTVASGSFTFDFRNYTTLNLYSTTLRIPHNSDGSKSLVSSASVILDGVGTARPSGTTKLTDIPRASSIKTFGNHTIGSNIAWAVDRKHAAFTHTIELLFAGVRIASATGQGASGTLGITLAMKEQMLRLVPNSLSGTATLRVRTFNGSTAVGDWVSKNATASVGADIVPTVTRLDAVEAVASVQTLVGTYVQGHSRALLSIVGAAGVLGSTIKSYRITGLGNTINAQSGTTNILGSSGVVEFTAVVTDSRGRTATTKRSITILKYDPPSVVDLETLRTNSTGVELWNGTFMRTKFQVKTQSLKVGTVEKNMMTLTIRRRQNGSSFFEQVYNETFQQTERGSQVISSNFDVTFGYDIELIVSDIFGVSFTSTSKITTGKVALDIGDDNIGVGKLYEEGRGSIDALEAIYHKDGIEVANGIVGVLGADTDLNDVLVSGVYTQTSNSTVSQMMNIPVKEAFILEVQAIRDIKQTFTTYTGDMYFRVFYQWANTWSPWVKVSTSPVTGWETISLKNGYSVYLEAPYDYTCEVKRDGDVVTIRGAMNPPANNQLGNNDSYIAVNNPFQLPAKYRPKNRVDVLCQGSGRAIWTARLFPDGQFYCNRYRVGNDSSNPAASTWLAFTITYIV